MESKSKKIYGALLVILILILISGILVVSKEKIFTKKIDTESITSSPEVKEDNETVNEDSDDEQLKELLEIKNNSLMMLVNRNNPLDAEYIPEDLVLSEIDFVSYIETRNLAKVTAEAAKAMFEDAAKEGIILLGASGYRSYLVQENLYNSRVINEGQEEADRYTAKPGQSEHQTGLALDILSEDYQDMDDNFDTTEAYAWLKENCYKYGFILRYPMGKEDITGFLYEPWHYRYIGNSEVAQEIMDRNLTFEEYIEELNSKIEELS